MAIFIPYYWKYYYIVNWCSGLTLFFQCRFQFLSAPSFASVHTSKSVTTKERNVRCLIHLILNYLTM